MASCSCWAMSTHFFFVAQAALIAMILMEYSVLFFSLAVTKSNYRHGGYKECGPPLLPSILEDTCAPVTKFRSSPYQGISSLRTKSSGWNLFALGGSP